MSPRPASRARRVADAVMSVDETLGHLDDTVEHMHTTLTNLDRAIFRLDVDVPDFSLAAGSYFLRWSMLGSLASGPWMMSTTSQSWS